MLLYQILLYPLHGKTKKNSCKSNKFKISAVSWNEKFESNPPDYFKNININMKH